MLSLRSLFQLKMFANKFLTSPQGLLKRLNSTNTVTDKRVVWVDCEMTGLDVDSCHLLEVACLVTDDQLNIVAEGPNIVIHQSDEILNKMNEWCIKQHGESGLTEQVRHSKTSVRDAEEKLLSFLRLHTLQGVSPLAGNTVYMDKRFLEKYMPQFVSYLHYRIIDVSTLKELTRIWFPKDFSMAPEKKGSHRALDDIKESIEELKYYKKSVFKAKEES